MKTKKTLSISEKKHIERMNKLEEDIKAIQKETEEIRKERELSEKKSKEELDQLRKERELSEKKSKDELDQLRKERELSEKKSKDELDQLRKETEAIRKANVQSESKLNKLGFNIGMSTEDVFYNSINNTKTIDNIHYDNIVRNRQFYGLKDIVLLEVDILAINDEYISVIEVKHRVTTEDIDKVNEKVKPFITNYYKDKNYTIKYYLAGGSIDKKIITIAHKNNIGLIQYRGEHFKVIS